jgi:Flp pilus assembly protein TadD
VLFKQGRLDEAAETLERARSLAPGEPVVLEHLGDVHAKRNDAAKGRDLYERALKLKPEQKLERQIQGKLRALQQPAS